MEQVIEGLATDLSVTSTPCSSKPARLDLFKKKPCHQESRRAEFLAKQKEKRLVRLRNPLIRCDPLLLRNEMFSRKSVFF